MSFGAHGTAYAIALAVSGQAFAAGAASAMRVARSTFDLQPAPNAGGLFLGDYHGLTSFDTTFLSFFSQTTQKGDASRTDVFALKLAPAAGASAAAPSRARAAAARAESAAS